MDARRLALFEDRYGPGWHARLAALIAQPCVSFADIAAECGVSRERVRQWHAEFFPQAPSGRERRRQCLDVQRRRRVSADPVFRAFYRHVRLHLRVERLLLIGNGTSRRRSVRVLGRVVVLRRVSDESQAAKAITRCRDAEYVYCLLPGGDFLIARRGDATNLVAFRNTFAAFGRIGANESARWRIVKTP